MSDLPNWKVLINTCRGYIIRIYSEGFDTNIGAWEEEVRENFEAILSVDVAVHETMHKHIDRLKELANQYGLEVTREDDAEYYVTLTGDPEQMFYFGCHIGQAGLSNLEG